MTINIIKNGSLSATGVNYTPSDSAYVKTGGTCSSTIVNDCTIEITFTPGTAQSYNGEQLDIAFTDGINGTRHEYVSLSGVGLEPATLEVVSPYSFNDDYADITVGGTYTKTFTITKGGDVNATSVVITGLAAPFSMSNTCSGTVSEDCDFTVTYNPTSSSGDSDTVNISYNDGVETKNISLSISANAEALDAAVLDSGYPLGYSFTWDYGDTPRNTTVEKTFTISNSGEKTASISGVYLTGTYAGTIFKIVAGSTSCNVGTDVTQGGTCEVVVSFTPDTRGTRVTSLVIEYDNGEGTASTLTTGISGIGE